MTSPLMNHKEAVGSMAVERYLLGELKDEERAAFEDHYLNCAECLDAVTFGDEFMGAAQPVARELALAEKSGHAPAPARESGSFFGRLLALMKSPAPAWALVVALAVVVSYQHTNQKGAYPDYRFPLTGMSHGAGEARVVTVPRESMFGVGVAYARSGDYLSYQAQVFTERGVLKDTFTIPAEESGETAWVGLLAETLDPGVYSVVVKGKTADGIEKEVGRGAFELRFAGK